MKKSLLIIAVCILATGNLSANPPRDFHGTFDTGYFESVEDDGLQINASMNFKVNWRLWTLLDEPVEVYNVAWLLDSSATIHHADFLGNDDPWRYQGRSIPENVLAQIRIIDARFWGGVRFDMLKGMSTGVVVDPGVMAKPVLVDDAYNTRPSGVYDKPEDRFFSFNTPGSPRWDEYFTTAIYVDGPKGEVTEQSHLSEDQARALMHTGNVTLGQDYEASETLYIRFDLSPVKEWLLGLERQEIATEKRQQEIKRRELDTQNNEREAERKKAEADDFWGTPATVETQDDTEERYEIEQDLTDLRRAETHVANLIQEVQEEKLKVDSLLFALREEVEGRPEPGTARVTEIGEIIKDDDQGWYWIVFTVFEDRSVKAVWLGPGAEADSHCLYTGILNFNYSSNTVEAEDAVLIYENLVRPGLATISRSRCWVKSDYNYRNKTHQTFDFSSGIFRWENWHTEGYGDLSIRTFGLDAF